MITLFLRTIRDRRNSILVYTLITVVLVLIYAAIFPSIKSQAKEMEQLFAAYPESMMKAFNINPLKMLTTFEGYIAAEQYSITWPILVIAMFVAWGGGTIAGEIEKGSIGFLLAQPVSRLKIFFAKYLAGVVALFVFSILTILCAIPFALIFDFDYQIANYLKMLILGFLFGLTVLSISAFFSSLFSEKGKVYFLSSGIFVLMYVINIVSALKENLADLKYLSFFYYFDANKALLDNKIDFLNIVVFLGVSLIFTFLGALIFNRRDISV